MECRRARRPAARPSRAGPYVIAAVGRSDYDYDCFVFIACDNARATSGKVVVGYRYGGGEVSWNPGDPMQPLQSRLAGGYAGVAGDLYPGLPIGRPAGISDGRAVVTTALMGNNGGRLVLLTPTAACSAGTCLRVATVTIAATNPSTCTGATRTATASITVRNLTTGALTEMPLDGVFIHQFARRDHDLAGPLIAHQQQR